MHIQDENKLINKYVDSEQGTGQEGTLRLPVEKLQKVGQGAENLAL